MTFLCDQIQTEHHELYDFKVIFVTRHGNWYPIGNGPKALGLYPIFKEIWTNMMKIRLILISKLTDVELNEEKINYVRRNY